MRRRRIGPSIFGVGSALVILVGVANAAVASGGVRDQVTGIEIGYTLTSGTFAGIASGTVPGVWQTVVNHSLPSQNGNMAITPGGGFAVYSRADGGTTVNGSYTGGTVDMTDAGPGCTNQIFAVNATLATAKGPGTFVGTLTHYRAMLFGQCTIYSASLVGSLAID